MMHQILQTRIKKSAMVSVSVTASMLTSRWFRSICYSTQLATAISYILLHLSIRRVCHCSRCPALFARSRSSTLRRPIASRASTARRTSCHRPNRRYLGHVSCHSGTTPCRGVHPTKTAHRTQTFRYATNCLCRFGRQTSCKCPHHESSYCRNDPCSLIRRSTGIRRSRTFGRWWTHRKTWCHWTTTPFLSLGTSYQTTDLRNNKRKHRSTSYWLYLVTVYLQIGSHWIKSFPSR